jgi:serine protease Do
MRGASYAPVIKKVTPSVVTITSTRTVKVRNYQDYYDEFFRQFFGDRYSPPRSNRPRTFEDKNLGSGVIVTEDGYILTNNHVVDGADPDGVKVSLADGKTKYNAKVVGKDPRTDIAVLKIEARDLQAITLANSDKLEVGDVVLAIGNPFNVGQSVTMGIVSALGRGTGILGQGGYEDFIQTDAAINPGNSGGALVDAEGRLVGINQSIFSRSGGNNGVGFAIPINLARSVLEKLATDGKIVRGYLGVDPQEVTPELAQAFKLPGNTGALIGQVVPDSPAAAAGVKEGDVIVEVNGKRITDPRHLRLTISQLAPKSKATLKVIRDGKERTLTATLGALAGDNPSEEPADNRDSKVEHLDGVEVSDLDNQTRRQLGIPDRIQGALVTKVEPDSKAHEAGLQEGDVILEIDRQPVKDAEHAVELSEKAKGDRVLVRVFRQLGGGQGIMRYISVEATRKK